MSVYIKGMNKPSNCLECPFLSKFEEFQIRNIDEHPNAYVKIAHCMLCPEEIEDPWRNTEWLLHNTESWCPIEQNAERPQGDLIRRDALNEHKFLTPQVKVIGGRRGGKTREQIIEAYQKGWNDCIDAIIDNAPSVKPCENCDLYFKAMTKEEQKGGAV